jgi:hypothetical protein
MSFVESDVGTWISEQEDSSVDCFLFWDALEDVRSHWSQIQRVGTKDAQMLVASREEEPPWLSDLAPYMISKTTDAHFCYGSVSWLGLNHT